MTRNAREKRMSGKFSINVTKYKGIWQHMEIFHSSILLQSNMYCSLLYLIFKSNDLLL